MMALSPQQRIVLAVQPIDFRVGIDGLARLCRQVFDADAFCGWIFCFTNRKRTAIKILVYDGSGFWGIHRRLSSGYFRHWPVAGEAVTALRAHELQTLLMGGDPGACHGAPAWRPLPEPRD
jgi:transposase